MKSRIKKPNSTFEIEIALAKRPNGKLASMLAKKLYVSGGLAMVKNLDYSVALYFWNGEFVEHFFTTSRHKAKVIYSAFRKGKLEGIEQMAVRRYLIDTSKKSLDYFIS